MTAEGSPTRVGGTTLTHITDVSSASKEQQQAASPLLQSPDSLLIISADTVS